MLSRILLLLSSYLLFGASANAQTETDRTLPYTFFREESYSILTGAHLQHRLDDSGKTQHRAYFELGAHHTIVTDAVTITHGVSLEISPYKQTILGLKYGGWVNLWFVSLGLCSTLYSNFTYSALIARPEALVGARRFRFVMGYNAPIIHNSSFYEIEQARFQLTANYLIRYPLKKSAKR